MVPEHRQRPWWVYILRCGRSGLYTGITTSVERRIRQHAGELPGGARFTRGRDPVLAYSLEVGAKSLASRLEWRIKRLPRAAKERIVAESMSLGELRSLLGLPEP